MKQWLAAAPLLAVALGVCCATPSPIRDIAPSVSSPLLDGNFRFSAVVSNALFKEHDDEFRTALRTPVQQRTNTDMKNIIMVFLVLVKIAKVAFIAMAVAGGTATGAPSILEQVAQAGTGIIETGHTMIEVGQEIIANGEDIYQAVQQIIETGQTFIELSQGSIDVGQKEVLGSGSNAVQQANALMGAGYNIIQAITSVMPTLLPTVATDPPSSSPTSSQQTPSSLRGTSDTAVARLRGSATGDLYFAQSAASRESEGPEKTIVSGIIEGLKPGLHELRIHRSGDTSADCSNVGEHYSTGGTTFVADAGGRAVLLLQESEMPLTGPAAVLGRSILITRQEGGEPPVCAIIVQH